MLVSIDLFSLIANQRKLILGSLYYIVTMLLWILYRLLRILNSRILDFSSLWISKAPYYIRRDWPASLAVLNAKRGLFLENLLHINHSSVQYL